MKKEKKRGEREKKEKKSEILVRSVTRNDLSNLRKRLGSLFTMGIFTGMHTVQ